MRITFYGAARTVTGSQHLIEVNGTRILLDCGLYQGRRDDEQRLNRHLPYDARSVDAVVLSHAHIDHAGNIPNLIKSGFKGDIYCTYATYDLAAVMLRDSGHIQERDAEYINRRRRSGEPRVDPVYTEEDAIRSLDFFLPTAYKRERRIADGVYCTLYDAGHMLGSAITVLDIEDKEAKRDIRLIFTGDIGRLDAPILRDPTTFDRADVLIMEATYGGRNHSDPPDMEAELREIINRTAQRRGKVIIPAFAVGRTQTVVYTLNRLVHSKQIPNLPVFVDSPLAVNATEVFRMHPEAFDIETSLYLSREDPDGDIFGFQRLEYVRRTERSKELNTYPGPAIIISASGMMEYGRIVHHLRHQVEDPRNTVLVVGWQAPNTLGRRLVEGEKTVRIWGDEYTPRAEVVTMNGFSGHADHKELLAWAGALKKRPQATFIVHAEDDPAAAFAADLRRRLRFRNVQIPQRGQVFTV